MKRILLFVIPLLIIAGIVFTIFAVRHIKFIEDDLKDDLERKARAVAESVEYSARYILLNRDDKIAKRLTEAFQKRERLQGCVLYDKDLSVFAITPRINELRDRNTGPLAEILANGKPFSGVEKFNQLSFYSYILPLYDDDNRPLGLVKVVYDTSYMLTKLAEMWRGISLTLIVLLSLIAVAAVLLQHRIFTLPLRRLTQWFGHFQKGETDKLRPFVVDGDLGKLVSEVEQVALSLRVARKAVTEQAHERIRKEDAWTESKLRDLVRARLGENALFVVSNREPFMHMRDAETDKVHCIRPASGVVTALDPILKACGGTWIAQAGGNADRQFVNSRDKLGVPPENNRYILKRVWLTKEEEEGYYYGFANEGLWPLCHVTHTRPIFRETDWRMYKQANRKFAESVLDELPRRNAFVFIQDYHFTLLPGMIKKERPDVKVALFWHIPWPTPEVFTICPYQQEILDGMLSCDLLGFHVQMHCNNFIDTANRLTECRVDTEKFSIVRGSQETHVRSFPISVALDSHSSGEPQTEAQIQKIKKEFDLSGKIVGIGVERIDYTKGLVERILAIDRFFEKYPGYRKKVVFVQLAAPSRTHIKRYHDLVAEIDDLVEKKNWRHSEDGWKPILYLKRHFSAEEISPYYRLADFCIVSSLHDGMNLVAKEYVAAKTDGLGALILSRFTGAARELTDAVSINPYAIEEFADAIKFAVDMPDEEKKKRMDSMRRVVEENNIYRWAGSIVSDLTALHKE